MFHFTWTITMACRGKKTEREWKRAKTMDHCIEFAFNLMVLSNVIAWLGCKLKLWCTTCIFSMCVCSAHLLAHNILNSWRTKLKRINKVYYSIYAQYTFLWSHSIPNRFQCTKAMHLNLHKTYSIEMEWWCVCEFLALGQQIVNVFICYNLSTIRAKACIKQFYGSCQACVHGFKVFAFSYWESHWRALSTIEKIPYTAHLTR